jgi:hypothetical protein
MNIKEFITAGNAIVTLVSKKTGVYYTYKVTRKNSLYFVKVLTRPNEYHYIGFFYENSMYLRPPVHNKNLENWTSYKAMAYTLRHIDNLTDVEVKHEGKCGRCGRRLTTPESIDRGIGAICLKYLKN